MTKKIFSGICSYSLDNPIVFWANDPKSQFMSFKENGYVVINVDLAEYPNTELHLLDNISNHVITLNQGQQYGFYTQPGWTFTVWTPAPIGKLTQDGYSNKMDDQHNLLSYGAGTSGPNLQLSVVSFTSF